MRFAVVKNDIVGNVIVADAAQKEDLESALSAELVDAQPYGLQIGDLRVDGRWTRNVEGEQTVLTGAPTYDDLAAQVADMKAALLLLGVTPEEV